MTLTLEVEGQKFSVNPEAITFVVMAPRNGRWGSSAKSPAEAASNCIDKGAKRSDPASLYVVTGDSSAAVDPAGYITCAHGALVSPEIRLSRLSNLIAS